MIASRVATLLNSLRESQLLDAKQLAEVAASPLAKGDDPMPLAKELVQRRGLTSFQVNQLLRGRGKALTVGPYRIVDRVGEGGMGQVYKAFHQPMNRMVALKVIRKELLANAQAVGRFYQEIRAAAQLVHPNIVIAYDAGQVGDTHYFAMEFVQGTDLAKLVKEKGPLPVARACDYVRQAALGLQHAHARGLVHRDIKPANLLLDDHGTVKLLDLGLARIAGSADETHSGGLTQTGAVVGTPHFLAPEQARNSRGVDTRADLYSLGCTLFYLLTGNPPFTGQELTEILLKHQMDPVPGVEQFRKDVPPGVQAILRKLTAKKPEDRYQTPAELATALAPFTTEGTPTEPVKASAPGGSGKVSRQMAGLLRRKPLLIGGAALGTMLILGVIVLAVLLARPRADSTKSVASGSSSASAVTTKLEPPPLFGLVARAVKENRYHKTKVIGGAFVLEEQLPDLPPEGALLIGFEVGLGDFFGASFVTSLRPIYLTAAGETLGKQYGKPPKQVMTFKAKKGYAVARIEVGSTLGVDGFVITYLKIGAKGLITAYSSASEQIGGKTGTKTTIGGSAPVIGIVTKQGADGAFLGLGLIVLDK